MITKDVIKKGTKCYFSPSLPVMKNHIKDNIYEVSCPIKTSHEEAGKKINIESCVQGSKEGNYIQQKGNSVAIATLNKNEGYIVTDNLTGCTFELYKNTDGTQFIGAHIYRGDIGGGNCQEVQGMAQYASENNLQRIYRWESRGIADAKLGQSCCCIVHMKDGNAEWGFGIIMDKSGGIIDVKDLSSS